MSLLHRIVSGRHNILFLSILSSGLCLDTIVVFSRKRYLHYRAIIMYAMCFREANRRIHSKPGAVPFVPERKKHIIGEMEWSLSSYCCYWPNDRWTLLPHAEFISVIFIVVTIEMCCLHKTWLARVLSHKDFVHFVNQIGNIRKFSHGATLRIFPCVQSDLILTCHDSWFY